MIRRVLALLLFLVGYAAFATLDAPVAALPAFTTFLLAALVLNDAGRPIGAAGHSLAESGRGSPG